MEAPPMRGTETERLEDAKLTSAAAFVEGGIQEACDDACSICLEEFCDSDPSTVTGCKHEFHLHCILEWCQRSSQCPMCWQPISLKDCTSQELLDAVVQERNLRINPPRNAPIFHHPTLGDFGIQHLPVGVNNAELEERIIQHFADAAEMGRTRHLSRREGHRNRSTNHVRPHFLVFSTQPHAHAGQASPARGESEPHLIISGSSPSSPVMIGEQSVHISAYQSAQSNLVSSPESSVPTNQHGMQLSRRPPSQTPNNQERTGPSDLHSFSEALRSRLSAMSIRYKESISKSTRGWKERWFSRNSPTAELGSQVSREVNPGITSVSRTMAHVERRENGSGFESAPSGSDVRAVSGPSVEQRSDPAIDSSGHHTEVSDSGGSHIRELYMQTPFAASSGSS